MKKLTIENILIALRAIRSQLLRAVLTVLIIAVGISALVGILTAIDSIEGAISTQFSAMGSNSFTIRDRSSSIRVGHGGKKPKKYRPISFKEATRFVEEYDFPSLVSLSIRASFSSTVKFRSRKTNPNISVFGADENYLTTSGYAIDMGRNFTQQEIINNAHVAIIGSELAENLFPELSPIDQIISIGSGKYRIIGLLEEKGSSVGFGGDRLCLLPISNVRQYFSQPKMSYVINVMTYGPEYLDPGINEAIGVMRVVRNDRKGEDITFGIMRSDQLATILIENLYIVTIVATVIGLITLLGAAIGLMNIMLVSVTERTREIGTRKAIGARSSTIRSQFLVEAIVICQIGGLLGIIFGIGLGNVTSLLMESEFVIPWRWILAGILICLGVGVTAGYYPANKAANLDPIDSLRYE